MADALFIEPLPAEHEAARTASEEERAAAAAFGSAQRRCEYLAWRAIVRRELGPVRIGYDATGAPILPERPELHLGISHCPGWVAVRIAPHRCAVDIEPRDRDFRRVASRYATPGELALWNDPRLFGILWCAKEALYKYAGMPGLSLRDELHVDAIDPDSGIATGRIKEGPALRLAIRPHDRLFVLTLP